MMMRNPYYKTYVSPSGERRVTTSDGSLRCDFCLMRNPWPIWTYHVAPMPVIGAIMNFSDDDWLVCEDCHALLDAHDVAGIAARAVDLQPVHMPPPPGYDYRPSAPRAVLIAGMRTNARRFLEAQIGPPERDPPPEGVEGPHALL